MPSDIIRVSIFGSLPGGDVWSVNPVFEITTGQEITYSEAVGAVNAINAVVVPTNLRAIMSASTTVTGCRVEARTYAGVLQAQAEGLRGSPVPGTGSSPLPFQSALVLSLRTAVAGGTGRGRLYWPATGLTLSATTLRPATALVTSFLADFKTYLTAVQAAIDGVVDETVALAVWSRVNASSAVVNRIMAGDVLDVQRRRRDAIPEAYQELSYV
jgi:hypothetical protein